ncbi:MAG: hypothetical protein EOO71_03750 [Myxococcaceae bacterium]|nr:MAG: hypothetical protein EOO71_03750 [Myxococcaceae bacterium]
MNWISAVLVATFLTLAPTAAKAQCVNVNSTAGLAITAALNALAATQTAFVDTSTAAATLNLLQILNAVSSVTNALPTVAQSNLATLPLLPSALGTDLSSINSGLGSILTQLGSITSGLASIPSAPASGLPIVLDQLQGVIAVANQLPPLCQ